MKTDNEQEWKDLWMCLDRIERDVQLLRNKLSEDMDRGKCKHCNGTGRQNYSDDSLLYDKKCEYCNDTGKGNTMGKK